MFYYLLSQTSNLIIMILIIIVVLALCFCMVLSIFQKYKTQTSTYTIENEKNKQIQSLSKEQMKLLGITFDYDKDKEEPLASFDSKKNDIEKIDTSDEAFRLSPEAMNADFSKDGIDKKDREEVVTDLESAKEVFENDNFVEDFSIVKYKKSLIAKLIYSDEVIKQAYRTIKNRLLSYKNVIPRMSFSHETFKCGKNHVACLTMRGKSLFLYLNLSNSKVDLQKFKIVDCKNIRKYAMYGSMFKIKNHLNLKNALLLIDSIGLEFNKDVNFEYDLFYRDEFDLLKNGLIK